ncbi:hypothetical protein BX265_0964 [Streptomyces sp. TLI_235]|nr:hypothetical protein [Streptomyces sp. TLI_235]PBC76258.1 hypothetical protein BX265_0964 [Streptomyces sp. TLI_235]
MDESFARVLSGYPSGLVIRPAVVRGGLGPALVATVEPDDLIVVGDSGGLVARLLRASPAGHCRVRARCAVLAVPRRPHLHGRTPAWVPPD